MYVHDKFPIPQENIMITIYYLKRCPHSLQALQTIQNFRDAKGHPLLYAAYDAEELMIHLLRKKKKNEKDLAIEGRVLFFQKLKKLIEDYSSFPLIFIRKDFLGGNSQLQAMLSKRK
jgi:glutaredoxin